MKYLSLMQTVYILSYDACKTFFDVLSRTPTISITYFQKDCKMFLKKSPQFLDNFLSGVSLRKLNDGKINVVFFKVILYLLRNRVLIVYNYSVKFGKVGKAIKGIRTDFFTLGYKHFFN